MPLEQQRDVPPSLRNNLILVNCLLFGGPVVLLFLLYGLRLVGIDPLNKRGDEEGVPASVYLTFAVIGVVICVPWCVLRIRKSVYLAKYGVEVIGKVTSISNLQKNGQMPMRYGYVFAGTTYTGATDIVKEQAGAYRANPQVRLLVDPAKPSRAMLYADVLGNE
jgi:hypothetical protein